MNRIFKLLFRIILSVLAVLVSLIALLALSIPIDAWMNRSKVESLVSQTLSASGTNAVDVAAFVARPSTIAENTKYPAVIMVHEFWGLKESIVGKAQALADEGYIVVAPDAMRGNTTSWLPRAIWQTMRKERNEINTDLTTTYAWLAQQDDVDPERIGIMGFCFGGSASMHYSLENPDIAATAIFYGSGLITEAEELKAFPGPVLGVFGATDQSIPVEEVNAFEAALTEVGIENQISIYPDKGHAFVQSMETIAEDPVQQKAWNELLTFLSKNL